MSEISYKDGVITKKVSVCVDKWADDSKWMDVFISKNLLTDGKVKVKYSDLYREEIFSLIDIFKEQILDENLDSTSVSSYLKKIELFNIVQREIFKAVYEFEKIKVLENKNCKCNTDTIMSTGCQCGGK